MTKRDRDFLSLRYAKIQHELAHIADCGVVEGDPAETEWRLLGELEEIEFTLGVDYFDTRDGLPDA